MSVPCTLAGVLMLHGGFTENRGQWPPEIRFVGRSPSGMVIVGDHAVSLVRPDGARRVLLDGLADPPRGVGDRGYPTHFLRGADPGSWIRDAPTWEAVVLPDADGGAPLRLAFEDDRLVGRAVHTGRALLLDDAWTPGGTGCLGGTYTDTAEDVVVRPDGTIVVAGTTTSTDFPVTTGAWDLGNAGLDVFVTALEPHGEGIAFSTFVGGTGIDLATAVAATADGDVVVHGSTWSSDFPVTAGAFRTLLNGDGTAYQPDLFVLRLEASGSDLVFGTFLGGTGPETAGDVALDADGRVVVVGRTDSHDFPTVGGPVPAEHGVALLAELAPDGTALTDAAFWGGSGAEEALSVAIDPDGDRIVGGWTTSLEFPTTPGAYQATRPGQTTGFVLRYRPSTRELRFSTFLGGTFFDIVNSVGVDGDGSVLAAGLAFDPGQAAAFPTTDGALDTTLDGRTDVFVARLDPEGTRLTASTFVGGDGDETPGTLVVHDDGCVAVSGTTTSDTGFPVAGGAWSQAHAGLGDAFLVVLDPDLSTAAFGSYLGGSDLDEGTALAPAPDGDLVLVGTTASVDFPTTDVAPAGDTDAFVAFLDGPNIPGDTSGDTGPDPAIGGGCGCTSGGAAVPGAGSLTLLLALLRRRGRPRRYWTFRDPERGDPTSVREARLR